MKETKIIKEGNPMYGENEYVYTEFFYEYMMDLQSEAMDSYLETVDYEVEYPFGCDDIPKDFTSEAIVTYNNFNEIYETLENSCEDFHQFGKLIHKDYWVKYWEEEIKESREIHDDIPYWIVVDVEATAEQNKTDIGWMSITVDGETWYYKKDWDKVD